MSNSSLDEKNAINTNTWATASEEEENILGKVITSIISPTGEKINITDVDEAMKYVVHEHITIDEATSNRLLRKIDLYLCPVMCLLYSIQYMDKVTNSNASIMGLIPDLHMKGTMYSWTGTTFYLGYLVFVSISSRLLQRFPVAKTLSAFVIVWGFIVCMHAVPNTYAGFMVLRTMLGMFESAVTPAFVIITSQWYKAEEQFLRTSIWFAFNGLGIILGNSIAYGLYIHGDTYSMVSWKILFIIVGLITVLFGFIILFHIPDNPTKAWFLNEEEKVLVVERIRSNNQGFGNKHFKMDQFKEAFTDVKTWILFISALANNIPNGGFTNFGSILMKETFGFSTKKSLLMGMPLGGAELVGCIGLACLSKSKYIKQRLPVAIFTSLMCVMATCLLSWAPLAKARLAGYYILGISPVGMICALSLFASNTAGHTKKVTVNAIFLIGYCVGNLIGPQTFRTSQAPSYSGAILAMVICYIVASICMVLLYYLYWRENKIRDEKRAELGDSYKKIENLEFADLTDIQNPDFRYAL